MPEKIPQTYANHIKSVPLYHFVILPILLGNFFWMLFRTITLFSVDGVINTMVALVLIALCFLIRIFPLGAQDRVIRLEERLRMHSLLVDDLKSRINEFTTSQLVALRFAGDEELSQLARRVIEGDISDQKSIKLAITNWRSDHQRL